MMSQYSQPPGYASVKVLGTNPPVFIDGLDVHAHPASDTQTPTSTPKMVSRKQFISLLEKKKVVPDMASADEVIALF